MTVYIYSNPAFLRWVSVGGGIQQSSRKAKAKSSRKAKAKRAACGFAAKHDDWERLVDTLNGS
jgi:hypothetical protein